MSRSLTILLGRLGKDPEVRRTQGGTAVCSLSVATDEKRKDQNGNWEKVTDWHKVVVWGNLAENCGKYLQKGRQVYIEGKNKTRKYNHNGVDKYVTEVVAKTVQFLGGNNSSEQGNFGNSQAEANYGQPTYDGMGGGVTFDDDDIPF